MGFSDHLLDVGSDLWAAQRRHPFVTELADGSLSEAAFRTWIEQDYRYLLDYARTFAVLGAKADEEATMAHCFEVANAIVDDEMELHRSFAADYGLTSEDLAAVSKAPTCEAYTNYLLRTARERPLAVGAAAIYPCGRGYLDVAEHMADLATEEHRYTPFVEKYTGDAFRESVAWMGEFVDRCADRHPSLHEEMEAAFLRCAELEHAFWEMAYTEESWPHERATDRDGARAAGSAGEGV
ncbi:thiaminase II [Candidatus Halobonum tyrrellensis]|uniref:TenA family transcriptional regulator n=1 Tax=Candidatus Halobonum tyrrellensis G22 TaxID=1324957 RepID=V4HJJ9_9EURY|nr:thiaminase II [Candidatus Halobonum tyrrellensis]ESP89933.1 TenA family transcriptional regulator [Candidatus Halobonum tyrrellensis G22]